MFSRRPAVLLLPLVLMLAFVLGPSAATAPTSATIAGDLQSELGCPGDWAPDCAATDLTPTDGVFVRRLHRADRQLAVQGGAEPRVGRELRRAHRAATTSRSAGTGGSVKFYYDRSRTGSPTNVNAVIATAPGSFQSELGCPGDWQPDCLRSWLQDPDGDGIYTFETTRDPGRHLRDEGRDQRDLGRELRRGRRARRREHRLHRPAPNAARHLHVRLADPRPDDPAPGHGPRQQRRVGRPAPRLARHALSHAAAARFPPARRSRSASARSTTT